MTHQHNDASTRTNNLPALPPVTCITNLFGDPPGMVTHWTYRPDIIISNGCAIINAGVLTSFSLFTTNTEFITLTNQTQRQLDGRFWLEWVVETNNHTPRRTMEMFSRQSPTNLWCLNAIYMTNMTWPFHFMIEPTEGVETTYVSSNLFFRVVWRGQTNSDCLESIPVRTEVRRWKIEKVYIP